MRFIPEKFTARDKVMALLAVLLLIGGAMVVVPYFKTSGPPPLPETSTNSQPGTSNTQATTAQTGTTKPRDLELQSDPEVTRRGGPRANPNYKDDGK